MRFWSTVGGLLQAKILGRPFYAKINVTRRCPLRCRMCSVWKYGGREHEMTLEEIGRVAWILREMGVVQVVVTGGEPFLRDDLPEIVQTLKRDGFSVRVQTSGGPGVTREKLARLVECGLTDLNVSLDSMSPEIHDSIRGREGVWEGAVDILKEAIRLLPGGMIGGSIVVSPRNIRELPDLIDYLDHLGAYPIPVPVMLTHGPGAPSPYRDYAEEMVWKEEERHEAAAIYEKVIERKKKGAKIPQSIRFLRDCRQVILTGEMRWRCDAGRYYFEIFPDGGISICNEKPPVANLLSDDFLSYRKSVEYREVVAQVIAQCEGCINGAWRNISALIRDPEVMSESAIDYLRFWAAGFQGRGNGKKGGSHAP